VNAHDAFDPNCLGLELPRGDGGVRELDVCICTPTEIWHLFNNAAVNGGYLGKSVIHFLVQNHPTFAASYPGGKFSKYDLASIDEQSRCFISFCSANDENLESVQDFIINKIPTLQSLRTKLRCINVPRRLNSAAAAAGLAAAAAAAAPPKARLDDNLYCRVVLFVKWSQVHAPLSDLFNRYYTNEQSRSRRAQDNVGFRSGDLLETMCEMFNSHDGFHDYVDAQDTHEAVLPSILGDLNPSAHPSPGPLFPDQLIQLVNWTRKTTTMLVNKYDRSGELEGGEERLRDIYENFCSGPLCPEPVDRPKVAIYMFASLGILFNQVCCCLDVLFIM
jgi:hypothetical protein